MKLLTLLTLSFLTAPALASEITSPFYIPSTGHVLSQTQTSFSKMKQTPGKRTYHRLLDEEISLGLGAHFSAILSGNLNWTHQKQRTSLSFPHKTGYSTGVKGQWALKGLLTQTAILYHQTNNVHFTPRRTLEGHFRFGKELKTLTPYLHLVGNFPLNARTEFNNPIYRGETGVFQNINNKMTLDTALYLQYDKNIKGKSYGIQAEWSYLPVSWVAIGLNGSWQARGHAKYNEKTYHKSIGIKTTFSF